MIEAIIGLVGVIIGSIITGAKELWTSWRSRRKNAEYLAIRVVSILDRYVDGCTTVVSDDGLCLGQPDADGFRRIQVSTPSFEVQSLDVDWKAIPANLMYQILSFPNSINAADRKIDGAFEYASFPPDFDEGFEERQYQYAVLGLNASNLADELRTAYGIPARVYAEWSPIDHLTEQRDRIVEIRTKRYEHNAKLMSSLPSESNRS